MKKSCGKLKRRGEDEESRANKKKGYRGGVVGSMELVQKGGTGSKIAGGVLYDIQEPTRSVREEKNDRMGQKGEGE